MYKFGIKENIHGRNPRHGLMVQPALRDEPRRSGGVSEPSFSENRPNADPPISGLTSVRYTETYVATEFGNLHGPQPYLGTWRQSCIFVRREIALELVCGADFSCELSCGEGPDDPRVSPRSNSAETLQKTDPPKLRLPSGTQQINPPTLRSACARLDSMSASQSQTESGMSWGMHPPPSLPPPGGRGRGVRGGGGTRCSIPSCNMQQLGTFGALLFRKYPKFRSLQTLVRARGGTTTTECQNATVHRFRPFGATYPCPPCSM